MHQLVRRGTLAQHAMTALKQIHSDEAVKELLHQFSSPSAFKRAVAAGALVELPEHAASIIPSIEEMVQTGNPETRETASSVLEGLGPFAIESVPCLLDELRRPDDDDRKAALGALQAIMPDADPRLFTAIRDLSSISRYHIREAADDLEKLGPEAALALPDLLSVTTSLC